MEKGGEELTFDLLWHNGRVLDLDREDPGLIPDLAMCKILGQDYNSVCASVHPAVNGYLVGKRQLFFVCVCALRLQ